MGLFSIFAFLDRGAEDTLSDAGSLTLPDLRRFGSDSCSLAFLLRLDGGGGSSLAEGLMAVVEGRWDSETSDEPESLAALALERVTLDDM